MKWWLNIYHNLFNIKFAIISALFNGIIATMVNWSYGPAEFLYAGIAQAISSFFSTGFTARIVQHFSPIKNPFTSYFLGSLVPATFTLILSLSAHIINQTPEIIGSCIAPVAISYSTSYVTNFITRKGYLRPTNYPISQI